MVVEFVIMAHRVALNTFRLATINVHSFVNPWTGQSNVEQLASILASLKLDLIAIEEAARGTHLRALQEHLSLPYSIFGSSYTSTHGNAVLSRYPFASEDNHTSDHRCRGGTRAMLNFLLDSDHPFVQNRHFAVTHLDHLDESDRVVQMTSFAPHRRNTNILLGDMNAITREDYSDDYLERIVRGKRQAARLESPRFELTRLLTNSFGFQDAFRQANHQLKDERVATCPYGTRIDYIFFRPLTDDQWKLKDCSIVDTQRVTDHQAVMATFEYQPN